MYYIIDHRYIRTGARQQVIERACKYNKNYIVSITQLCDATPRFAMALGATGAIAFAIRAAADEKFTPKKVSRKLAPQYKLNRIKLRRGSIWPYRKVKL